jgi:AcrR family transcriptional regulator
MGAAGAPTWHAILDGAEDILREEGYAALNAKRIAERIGIKRQLIYYYFCDTDDLYLELFHRIADRALDHLKSMLDSSRPLRDVWDVGINTFDQTLILEFMALANHNPKVHQAMLEYAEVSRNLQVAALQKVLQGKTMPTIQIPYPALAFIATWVALGVQREAASGINNGHQEVQDLIKSFLDQCEPPPHDAEA